MTSPQTSDRIVFHDVSKFYGEVLGVNKVNLEVAPGLTGLVGPNGSGKSTLMHLMTGLLRPSRGEISVLGVSPGRPEQLFHLVGYCTQYDNFPNGSTGLSFLRFALALHGATILGNSTRGPLSIVTRFNCPQGLADSSTITIHSIDSSECVVNQSTPVVTSTATV